MIIESNILNLGSTIIENYYHLWPNASLIAFKYKALYQLPNPSFSKR